MCAICKKKFYCTTLIRHEITCSHVVHREFDHLLPTFFDIKQPKITESYLNVQYCCVSKVKMPNNTQYFGNWICFCSQVKMLGDTYLPATVKTG